MRVGDSPRQVPYVWWRSSWVALFAALCGCATSGPTTATVGFDPIYDSHYDGYYGPYRGGYWDREGNFWYADGRHIYTRDDQRHFRRQPFPGSQPVRGERRTGSKPEPDNRRGKRRSTFA